MKQIIFRISRFFGLFALAKKITAGQTRILCYHAGAIGDENQFNPKLFCPPQLFRERMNWLEQNGYSVISLSDALRGNLSEQAKREWPVVITFDDGWASTASQLVPIIAEKKWPSTLYLCTRHFIEGWPVLNVAVRYILWKCRSIDHSSTLTNLIPGLPNPLKLSDYYNCNITADIIVNWIEKTQTNANDVIKTLEKTGECLGLKKEDVALDSRRFQYMNLAELLGLSSQHCEIGLHGHNHLYPKGNLAALKQDIEINRKTIRDVAATYSEHYCYPSGEYDEFAAEWLMDCGIVSATVCKPGLYNAKSSQSKYYIPRFLDGGSVTTIEFEAEMSGFSNLIRNGLSILSSRTRGV